MRIGFILAPPVTGHVSPIMPEAIALLRARGAEVDVIFPEENVTALGTLGPRHDLYVLKSGTELALSLAGALHAAGAGILNPYPVAAACRDKIVATRMLRGAGVPVPASFVAGRMGRLAPLLRDGALVVKPYRGSQGRGVRVVRRRDELDALDAGDGGPCLVQRHHEPDGPDRKIYRIGERVFGVERVWPARTYEEKLGQPFAVSPALREIADRCGRAFHIDLYGFDVVVSAGRPYVVDMSSFPGFKGVPDAARHLADHIFATARRLTRGERAGRARKAAPL